MRWGLRPPAVWTTSSCSATAWRTKTLVGKPLPAVLPYAAPRSVLQYFAPEDLEREFIEAGFSVKGLYSDVAGTPYDRKSGEFAVIANRV